MSGDGAYLCSGCLWCIPLESHLRGCSVTVVCKSLQATTSSQDECFWNTAQRRWSGDVITENASDISNTVSQSNKR